MNASICNGCRPLVVIKLRRAFPKSQKKRGSFFRPCPFQPFETNELTVNLSLLNCDHIFIFKAKKRRVEIRYFYYYFSSSCNVTAFSLSLSFYSFLLRCFFSCKFIFGKEKKVSGEFPYPWYSRYAHHSRE